MTHRMDEDVAKANWDIPDPGNGGTIRCEKRGICSMVCASGAETRVIGPPQFIGQEVSFGLKDLSGTSIQIQFGYIVDNNNAQNYTLSNLKHNILMMVRHDVANNELRWVRKNQNNA